MKRKRVAKCIISSLLSSALAFVYSASTHAIIIDLTGTISGTINNTFIEGTLFNSGGTDTEVGLVSAQTVFLSGGGTETGNALFPTNNVHCPLCKATGGSPRFLNLFDLTNGNFQISTQYTFDTGETFNHLITSTAITSSNWIVDSTVNGFYPTFEAFDEILIDPYFEKWSQISLTTIKAIANRTFSVNGVSQSYREEATIFYNTGRLLPGKQRRVVENVVGQFGNPEVMYLADSTFDVPEPSTLALFVIGFAGLGFTIRRRRMAYPRIGAAINTPTLNQPPKPPVHEDASHTEDTGSDPVHALRTGPYITHIPPPQSSLALASAWA